MKWTQLGDRSGKIEDWRKSYKGPLFHVQMEKLLPSDSISFSVSSQEQPQIWSWPHSTVPADGALCWMTPREVAWLPAEIPGRCLSVHPVHESTEGNWEAVGNVGTARHLCWLNWAWVQPSHLSHLQEKEAFTHKVLALLRLHPSHEALEIPWLHRKQHLISPSSHEVHPTSCSQCHWDNHTAVHRS